MSNCKRCAELEGLLREALDAHSMNGEDWLHLCVRINAALAGTAPQPTAVHPNALAGETGDAILGRIAMRFVDRAGDYCEVDPAERICDEFSKAMGDEVDRQWYERMARDASTSVPTPAVQCEHDWWKVGAYTERCGHCGVERATPVQQEVMQTTAIGKEWPNDQSG